MKMRMGMKGFNELIAGVENPALLREPILRVMQGVTSEGRNEAIIRANSPMVAASMMAEATPALGRVYSTLPQAQAAAIDRGRAPGGIRGGKQPPVDVVAAWAQRRGIDQSAVVPIARAIRARGIKGRFFMRGARKVIRQALPAYLALAGIEITAKIAQDVNGAPSVEIGPR